tara:strand:+ start:168 stop:614 length:447 start_codon:yes stop_codon:yes gene_type:complete
MVVVSKRNENNSTEDSLNLRILDPSTNQVLRGAKSENNFRKNLILSLSDSYQVIELEELIYCESDSGYTTFYLNNGKNYMVSKPLKEYEDKLESLHFTRPHQSFIINLRFIDKVEKSGTIHLKNGMEIPVSSRRKEAFVTTFLNYHSL